MKKIFSRNKRGVFQFFTLLYLLLLPFLDFGQAITLSPGNTFIAVPDKFDNLESKAAQTLKQWLKKIYGTDSGFLAAKESSIPNINGSFIITIGKTKFNSATANFPDNSPYGFTIERKGLVLSLQGATALGTMLATGYFLDHYCGVRFYMPGELFTSMPKANNVQLPAEIMVKEIPSTRYVYTTGFINQAEIEWANINGLVRKNWQSHQHTMGERFFNDTIFKQFPAIFPVYKGQRYFPTSKTDQNWQPDFSEPTLVDAASFSTINYFKANPTIDYISFSVQDNNKAFATEGKTTQNLQRYPNNSRGLTRGYSDENVSFLNNLAERLAKDLPANGITTPKTIVYIAYSRVNDIPKVKLNPAILPITVFHLSESLMDSTFNDTGSDITAYHRLSEWAKVTKRIGNDDWAEGKGVIYPKIYTGLVSDFVKAVKKNKMDFEYAHVEAYPNWALDGPKYYFMSRLYWNADLNPDQLLTGFCQDMFGKAASQMKDYFVTIENLNTSMNNDPLRNRRLDVFVTQLGLNKRELQFVKAARSDLDKAASLAETDNEKKRIALFSSGFKLTEYFFDIYNSPAINNDEVAQLKDYIKNTVAGNPMILNTATSKNFIDDMNGEVDKVVKYKLNPPPAK